MDGGGLRKRLGRESFRAYLTCHSARIHIGRLSYQLLPLASSTRRGVEGGLANRYLPCFKVS